MSLTIAISPSSFAETDKKPMKLLESAGVNIKSNPYGRRLTESEIIKHLVDVDGLIAGLEPLNDKVLTSTNKLKAISRVGIGTDNVDLAVAKELNIDVTNTPDAPSFAVAEMTVTALLAIQRNIISLNEDMHEGLWNKVISPGLNKTALLIIGYGRIGQTVCELLSKFQIDLMVYDPYLKADSLHDNIQLVSLSDGLSKADIISLHASGKDVILDKNAFSLIKNGAILLNSARGELIDEDALVNALDSGLISGAWIDTFATEPYNGRLSNYKQVILTPHVSTYTKSCRLDMEMQAVKNLLKSLNVT
jgi:D-3-phosphoglycerate dehydrogenase